MRLNSLLTNARNRPDRVLTRSTKPLSLDSPGLSSHLNSWSHVDLRYVGNVLGAVEPTLACCEHRDGRS